MVLCLFHGLFEVRCVLSSFAIIMMESKRAGCFTLFVFLIHCDWYRSVALPRSAVGWSAECGCGIS